MGSPEIANSSPAYLGRIPAEHDRKRQLQFIDRTLGLDRLRLGGANSIQPIVSQAELGNRLSETDQDGNSKQGIHSEKKQIRQPTPPLVQPATENNPTQ